MLQCMKPEPASPDQRVPSQSKTAIWGERSRTDWWNSAGVRTFGRTCGTVCSTLLRGALVLPRDDCSVVLLFYRQVFYELMNVWGTYQEQATATAKAGPSTPLLASARA